MPATVFPNPARDSDVRIHFLELGDSFDALVGYLQDTDSSITCAADLFTKYAREALRTLETASRVKFFSTRFCTRELAAQNGLVLGTDYDRTVQAVDYDIAQWQYSTGRIDLDWGYLNAVHEIKLTLQENRTLYDIPDAWINRDDEMAHIHLIPGQGSITGSYLMSIFPVLRSAHTGIIPLLLHPWYEAGLVTVDHAHLDAYDPATAAEHTDWDPDLVTSYQENVGKLVAAQILGPLGRALDFGGVNVSFDGLSQSLDVAFLAKLAKSLKEEALDWAENVKVSGGKGVPLVFV